MHVKKTLKQNEHEQKEAVRLFRSIQSEQLHFPETCFPGLFLLFSKDFEHARQILMEKFFLSVCFACCIAAGSQI